MSSRVSIREKVQQLFHGRDEPICSRNLASEIDTEQNLNLANVDVVSSRNSSARSVDESDYDNFPDSLSPNVDRRQQALDLDSSIASAMTALDASLTSIPETELVWLRDRSTLPSGSVSDQECTTPAFRRAHTSSWSTNGGGANGATGSFGSTVTDFDYLTSPGAQAERNAEYQQALQLAQHFCTSSTGQVSASQSSVGLPVGFPMVTGLPYQQAMPVLCLSTSAGPESLPHVEPRPYQPMPVPFGTSMQMQLRAQELEAYADQLMAQALEAKAAVLRLQTETGSDACPYPTSRQDATGSRKAHISVGCSVPEPDILPVVSILPETERTTIMLRNLPNDYTRNMVLDLLDEHGFACCYDFVYVPMDSKRRVGLGYAFVNLTRAADAKRAFDLLAGFSEWKVPGSVKVLEVAWGNPLQGFDAHVERYRNSPIMHPDVPEELRPLIFENGMRVEFPAPTQPLRAPRSR